MLDYLDTLRKKPLHVRQQIAVITTALLSLVILTVWWGSFTAQRKADAEIAAHEKSPVAVVADAWNGLWGNMAAKWREATGQVEYISTHADLVAGVGASDASSTVAVVQKLMDAEQ